MTGLITRIVCCCIALVTAAAAVSVLAEPQTPDVVIIPQDPDVVVILADSFDDNDLSDWQISSGGSVSLDSDHYVSPGYSLELEKLPEKKTCSATHALGTTPTVNKRLYLEVDMMCWRSGGTTDLYLKLMSGNKEVVTLAFHWSFIQWFDGGWHSICAFYPSCGGDGDMWYHVKILADMDRGVCDIYVTDGDAYHSGNAFGVPFRGSTHSIDTVCLQAGWSMMSEGSGEAFWVDNLVVKA